MATPELNEAIDGGLGLAVRMKDALADGKITLDELVQSVSNGKVRGSIEALYNSIDSLLHGGKPDWSQLLEQVASAALDFISNLSIAIKRDGFQVTDLLDGVSDGGVRTDLQKAMDGAEKIPDEISHIGMADMFALFQRVSMWIPKLVPHS